MQLSASRKLESSNEMRCIFEKGKDAWNEVIPRNSKEVLGPAVFSADNGMPSSVNAWMSVVSPDPAECLGKRVEYLRAASASEGEADCKVVGSFPGDPEEVPEVRMDGKDFEGAGDVCFG